MIAHVRIAGETASGKSYAFATAWPECLPKAIRLDLEAAVRLGMPGAGDGLYARASAAALRYLADLDADRRRRLRERKAELRQRARRGPRPAGG